MYLFSSGNGGLTVPELTFNRVNGKHVQKQPLVENKASINEGDNDKEKKESDPMFYIGVTCDGCSGIVKGLCFKCLVC